MTLGRFARVFSVPRKDSRRILQLALPVVAGSLSYTLLSVVDTAMLGHLGSAPLAASGVAGVLFFALVFSLGSISVGVQTLTARRFGEGVTTRCGEVLRSGLLFSVAIGVPLIAASPWIARWASPLLSPDPIVAGLGSTYLRFRLLGAAFSFASWTYAAFFAAIGKTRHQMHSSILVTLTNILLDYLLIFGHAGFPKLGVAGAAIASTAAVGVGASYYVAVSLLPFYRSTFSPYRGPVPLHHWARPILRLSLPILLQRAFSHGSWFAFFFVASRIGTNELAATNVIRSVYSLSIMLAIGMGTAASALVGQNLGARRSGDAERMGWGAAKLAAYAMGTIGLLFLVAPGAILRIYTSDPSVIAVGRLPLMLLGFVQGFAGIALVLSQSLQGAGNTRFVMIVEIFVCSGLYLPTVFLLGLVLRAGLVGAWTAEYLYWTVLAVIMSWKFRQAAWKRIVV
jgi:putative MATE family efflux protein